MFDQNKNLYSIKIRLKSNKKGVFITFYRILQAYSNKTFCWFSLVKRPIALAIGLPDVGGEFGSCSLIIGIL
ncbi:hypothetical protein [Helicobacter pylori]|uniref:hypothetical protein n=1 Tax=Helicobacter pylori TaxID=210 RepID=UPI000BBAE50D|nr:hypothetical protein [Helicobacter pylori]